MRSTVIQAVEGRLQQHGRAGEAKHDQRIDEHRQHRELHLAHLDFLAEVFGRAADHQSGDEYRDDRDNEKAIKPGADAARPDAAGQNVEHRHEAAERRQRIVHRDDRAGPRPGRADGKQGG